MYGPDKEDDDDDINEWQHVEHPFPEESPSTVHQLSGESNNFVIDENYLVHGRRSASVPPANAEDDQSSSSPSSPASASQSCVSDEEGSPIPSPSQSEWLLRAASEGWKLLKVRFETIKDGIVRVASRVREYAICVGAFWSIAYITGAALATAALLIYVGIQRRRRRRLRTLHLQRLDHLACLLRERDEVSFYQTFASTHQYWPLLRISELLLQIAHLNELLSSRRKVPVLRING